MSTDSIRLVRTFEIKEEYLTTLPVTYSWTSDSGLHCSTMGDKVHPSFEGLRTCLEEVGYIKTERWWNGDRVLQSFRLNGALFQPGDRFLSPEPLKEDIKRKRKEQNEK